MQHLSYLCNKITDVTSGVTTTCQTPDIAGEGVKLMKHEICLASLQRLCTRDEKLGIVFMSAALKPWRVARVFRHAKNGKQ